MDKIAGGSKLESGNTEYRMQRMQRAYVKCTSGLQSKTAAFIIIIIIIIAIAIAIGVSSLELVEGIERRGERKQKEKEEEDTS